MPEQINLNKDGRERDYGPFSNDGKDDISPAMKAAIESLATMDFPKDADATEPKENNQEQPQNPLSNDEQIKN